MHGALKGDVGVNLRMLEGRPLTLVGFDPAELFPYATYRPTNGPGTRGSYQGGTIRWAIKGGRLCLRPAALEADGLGWSWLVI